jgi:hypothetical protein
VSSYEKMYSILTEINNKWIKVYSFRCQNMKQKASIIDSNLLLQWLALIIFLHN